MSVLDFIGSILAPHRCSGCRQEGYILCPACGDSLAHEPVTIKHDTYTAFAVTRYTNTAKLAVRRLKFDGAQAAAADLARHMAPLIPVDADVLVPAPTSIKRRRQRGYDQAYLLCRNISRKTVVVWRTPLLRISSARQVGTSRAVRLTQLQGAFRVQDATGIVGKHVVLIDDVLTTGGTLAAAAQAILDAGATKVTAVVFAAA